MSWAGLCPVPPGSGAVASAGITRQRDVSVAGVGARGGAPKSSAFPGCPLAAAQCAGRRTGPPGAGLGMAGEGSFGPVRPGQPSVPGHPLPFLSCRRDGSPSPGRDPGGGSRHVRVLRLLSGPNSLAEAPAVAAAGAAPVRQLRRFDGVGRGLNCVVGRR